MGELLFHKEHAWIKVEEEIGTIGISDFAQKQLGDILYVDIPDEGTEVVAGKEFGQIESAKSMSSLVAPVSGEVIEAHEFSDDDPEIISLFEMPDDMQATFRATLDKTPAELGWGQGVLNRLGNRRSGVDTTGLDENSPLWQWANRFAEQFMPGADVRQLMTFHTGA